MNYLDLFLGFLKVGCFSFGGAYAAIPLVRDVVLSNKWLSEEMLTYIIAVSESTPGPIMVNLATYIGKQQMGFWGAVIATTAVILPAFIIILVITIVLKTALKNKYFQALLQGLKPCVIGVVLATGTYIIIANCINTELAPSMDIKSMIMTILLVALLFAYKRLAKKELSPILLIAISACLGIIGYAI